MAIAPPCPPPPRGAATAGVWGICEKMSEIIWNAWNDMLFNVFDCITSLKMGFCEEQTVWNQIKIWTPRIPEIGTKSLLKMEIWQVHAKHWKSDEAHNNDDY